MAIDGTYEPTEEELELLQRWYAPDVAQEVEPTRTNALGMNVAQLAKNKAQAATADHGVSVEDVEQSPAQLSAQDLEQISDQAKQQGFDEGLVKGKEQGIANGYEEGYNQGIEQGIESGTAQGLEQAQLQIDEKIALLDNLIAQLSQPIAQQDDEIERSLVNLSLMLAKKVIHCEILQNPKPLQHAIAQGLNILSDEQTITIKLHPDDMTHAQQVWDESTCEQRKLSLQVDPSLSQGDCVLESASSSVALDLDDRCNQVFDDFMAQPSPDIEGKNDEP